MGKIYSGGVRGWQEEREARKTLADAEKEREKRRREFEEHRRLSLEPGLARRAVEKVRSAAKRLRQQANPKHPKRAQKATGGQLPETARGDDRHVSLPIAAVNKAAMANELYSISRFLQGAILATVRPTSEFARAFSDEERGLLIAMASHVRRSLPRDMRMMLETIVAQHLDPTQAPTLSEIGAQITAADDERVRKGGVVGYYRALFQAIGDLQKEYMIGRSTKRIAAKRGAA